jgi:hypothetical protein
MRPRTARFFVSAAALIMATGCSISVPNAASLQLPAMPFRQLGTVTGVQSTLPYTSGVFSYNQTGPLRWYSDTSNGAYTPGDGNTITFTFFGSGLHLYGSLQARGCPDIPVVVDGVPYSMSCYLGGGSKISPQFDQTLLDIPTLPLANHTVTITNPTRGKYVYFTRAVIDLPPPIAADAVVTPGNPYVGPPVWGP